MQDHMTHFIAMGGYANYVWPAYVMVIGSLLVHVGWTRRQRRQIMQVIKQRLQRGPHE